LHKNTKQNHKSYVGEGGTNLFLNQFAVSALHMVRKTITLSFLFGFSQLSRAKYYFLPNSGLATILVCLVRFLAQVHKVFYAFYCFTVTSGLSKILSG